MSNGVNTNGTDGNDALSVGTDANAFLEISGSGGNDTIDFCNNSNIYVGLSYSSFGSLTVDMGGNSIAKYSDTGRAVLAGTDTMTNRIDIFATNTDGGIQIEGTAGGDVFTGGGNTAVGANQYFYQEFLVGLGNDTVTGAAIPSGVVGNGVALGGEVGFATRVDWRSIGEAINISMSGPGSGTATYTSGGTSYTDTLTNVNQFETGDGNDTIVGSDLDELFRVRGGNDIVNGGGGSDTIRYSSAVERIEAYLDEGIIAAGSFGSDTVSGIENVIATDFADIVHGGSDANILIGRSGQDTMDGLAGADVIYGNTDADSISGGDGSDTIFGGKDADSAYGDNGADVVYGNLGNDTLFGGTDADTLYGGQDQDLMSGEGGADRLFGNLGNDTLYGNSEADYLEGGSGSDTLYGGEGVDTVVGGTGADLVQGNKENDVLTGGSDGDTFAFGTVAQGIDVITDFNFSEGDRIDISGGFTLSAVGDLAPDLAEEVAKLTVAVSDTDSFLTIDGGAIVLSGITTSEFSSDFLI